MFSIEFPAITIKQAKSEDAASILPLLAQFIEEDGFEIAFENLPTAIAAMLNDPGSSTFVAWHGVDALGVATVAKGHSSENITGIVQLFI